MMALVAALPLPSMDRRCCGGGPEPTGDGVRTGDKTGEEVGRCTPAGLKCGLPGWEEEGANR